VHFEVQVMSDGFFNVLLEKLKGEDFYRAYERARWEAGSILPIKTIDLDEDDLNYLARYRRLRL
jgi:hypothetical protein